MGGKKRGRVPRSPRDDFRADMSTFTKYVQAARELVSEGRLRMLYSLGWLSGEIEANVRPEELEAVGVDEQDFREVWDREISPIMIRILSGTGDGFIEGVAEAVKGDPDEKEFVQSVRQKAELLQTTLVDDTLRRRYYQKVASRLPTLRGMTWEINRKEFDSEHGKLGALPYALISLHWNRQAGDDPVERLFALPTAPVTFSCDAVDIAAIIDTLQLICSELGRVGNP